MITYITSLHVSTVLSPERYLCFMDCVVSHILNTFYRNHRRRIKTEEKANVVSAVRGIKFIQILAALAFLHLDNFEE